MEWPMRRWTKSKYSKIRFWDIQAKDNKNKMNGTKKSSSHSWVQQGSLKSAVEAVLGLRTENMNLKSFHLSWKNSFYCKFSTLQNSFLAQGSLGKSLKTSSVEEKREEKKKNSPSDYKMVKVSREHFQWPSSYRPCRKETARDHTLCTRHLPINHNSGREKEKLPPIKDWN